MALKDNREFIDALHKAGELVRVKQETDWDCEIGAITRRLCETVGSPAALFENITDYAGHRILANSLANWRRIAIAIGLDPESPVREICEEYYARSNKRIKPIVVKKAPCQENVFTGDDVDLTMFPAPMVHDGDGGRYISTWHIVIAKDPDSDWTNWGMYRQMIHSKRYLGGLILPTSEMGGIKAKYEAAGKTMPFATAIGGDPVSILCGSFPVGPGISEVDIAGGMRQEPVELVKAVTSDLMVPAQAEIILEGELVPGVQVDEGPFGEFTGFRTSPRAPRPVYKVTAITHRNDPILTMSNMGMPVDESTITVGALGYTLPVRRLLEEQRIPITGVYSPPEMQAMAIVVGTKVPYNHIAMQIAGIVFGLPVMWGYVSKLIVVDDTVDPYNLNEVLHALGTKLHPAKGIHIFPSFGAPLQPFLSLDDRIKGHSAKVLFDCTWPVEWDRETEKPVAVSFKNVYSEEMQKKVLLNWGKYGFK